MSAIVVEMSAPVELSDTMSMMTGWVDEVPASDADIPMTTGGGWSSQDEMAAWAEGGM